MTSPTQTAWRSALETALQANVSVRTVHYAQLATIREDGRPANRTVVYRGDFEPSGELIFTTDLRSEKVRQTAANPSAELCWFFPASREQFRLLGRLQVVDETAQDELAVARMRIWQALPERSRQSFTWPTPGAPRSESVDFGRAVPLDVPSTFALLLLNPERVDHLDLRAEPHHRTLHRFEYGVWSDDWINP
ncbi:MAG: hypothetical protein NVSMB9_16920 [Isosphaeraceae bacterium]